MLHRCVQPIREKLYAHSIARYCDAGSNHPFNQSAPIYHLHDNSASITWMVSHRPTWWFQPMQAGLPISSGLIVVRYCECCSYMTTIKNELCFLFFSILFLFLLFYFTLFLISSSFIHIPFLGIIVSFSFHFIPVFPLIFPFFYQFSFLFWWWYP